MEYYASVIQNTSTFSNGLKLCHFLDFLTNLAFKAEINNAPITVNTTALTMYPPNASFFTSKM